MEHNKRPLWQYQLLSLSNALFIAKKGKISLGADVGLPSSAPTLPLLALTCLRLLFMLFSNHFKH